MSLGDVPPLPPGCPWSGWTPPNIKWCEDNLCAWITTPANSWSNLAYIAVGILMWRRARRLGNPAMAYFGPASIALGLFSFLYHASYTFFFQFFDFVGMFLFLFLFISSNIRRAGLVGQAGHRAWYVGGVAVSSALIPPLHLLRFPYQLLIAVLVLAIVVQECRLALRDGGSADRRWFGASLGLMLVATAFTLLDLAGALFSPDNHIIQGHALWHVFTALSLWAAFRFYEQFRYEEEESVPEGAPAVEEARA